METFQSNPIIPVKVTLHSLSNVGSCFNMGTQNSEFCSHSFADSRWIKMKFGMVLEHGDLINLEPFLFYTRCLLREHTLCYGNVNSYTKEIQMLVCG